MLNKTRKVSENETESERSPLVLKCVVGVALLCAVFVVGWLLFDTTTKNRGTEGAVDDTADTARACLDRVADRLESCIELEIVREQQDVTQGLSGREELQGGTGMLFDFRSTGRRCMWMKDMAFALDMVWLDENKAITSIETSVLPESFPETFCGSDNDRYVLEINEGVVNALGLQVGQSVRW